MFWRKTKYRFEKFSKPVTNYKFIKKEAIFNKKTWLSGKEEI